MHGVFTTEEAEVDEEDEFADEYDFHNDCLLNSVDEIITPNIQEAQDHINRKLERVRKALERKEREKDILLKEGPEWDEAQNLFKKKELTLEKMKIGSYWITLESFEANIQTSTPSMKNLTNK